MRNHFPVLANKVFRFQMHIEAWFKGFRNRKYKQQRLKYFVPENLQPEHHKVIKAGDYTLTIDAFSTTKGGWAYTRGIVSKGDIIIAEIYRNYSSFWHSFTLEHPDGHDYLLCGENYQGQTIIQLDTGKRKDYLENLANVGIGFCWAGADVSPDKTKLLVDGCYWAAPYEWVVYDFSSPMNLPYKQLARDDLIDKHGEMICEGWINNETLKFKIKCSRRISDGINSDFLTNEEEMAALKNGDLEFYEEEKLIKYASAV